MRFASPGLAVAFTFAFLAASAHPVTPADPPTEPAKSTDSETGRR